jgi:capsular polysaccharide transport system ATP-binding protein
MIEVMNLHKSFETRNGHKKVLNGVSLQVTTGQRLGIWGSNGSGKSTLIKILAKVESADSGSVKSNMSISWPLAFSGGFQGSLSGNDNIKFISRIYNVDYTQVKDYVEEFTELGKDLFEPVKSYSSGMTAKLAFALSMALDFDCLLIDEVLAVGDARFRNKCRKALLEDRAEKSLILVTHNIESSYEYCNSWGILNDGKFIPCTFTEVQRRVSPENFN